MKGAQYFGRLEMKFLCAFVAGILTFSVFSPFGYGLRVPPSQQGCGNEVFTEKIDFSDYRNLVDVAWNYTQFDGFGNPAAGQVEKRQDAAGIPDTSGGTNVANSMTLTNDGKPMYLYDVVKHQIADPDDAKGCFLGKIATQGYMSYATRVDWNTRYCTQYLGKDCASGNPSSADGEKAKQTTDRLQYLGNARDEIDKQSPSVPEVEKNLKNAGASDSDVGKITACLNGNEGGCPCLVTNLLGGISSTPAERKTCALKEFAPVENALNAELAKAMEMNPLNIVQSNSTDLFLDSGGNTPTILAFPESLVNYLNYLKNLEGFDFWYTVLSTSLAGLNIASMYKSYRTGQLLKLGKGGFAKQITDLAGAANTETKAGQKALSKLGKIKSLLTSSLSDAKTALNGYKTDAEKTAKLLENAKSKGLLSNVLSMQRESRMGRYAKLAGVDDQVATNLLSQRKYTELSGKIGEGFSSQTKTIAEIETKIKDIGTDYTKLGKFLSGAEGTIGGKEAVTVSGTGIRELIETKVPAVKTELQKLTEVGNRVAEADLTKITAGLDAAETAGDLTKTEATAARKIVQDLRGMGDPSKELNNVLKNPYAIEEAVQGQPVPDTLMQLVARSATRSGEYADFLRSIGALDKNYEAVGRFGGSVKGALGIFLLKMFSGGINWIRAGMVSTYVTFIAMFISEKGQGATPVISLSGIEFQLSPNKKLLGDESAYFEVARVSGYANQVPNTYSQNTVLDFTKLLGLDWDKVFGPSQNIVKNKMQNIGEYEVVIDQESSAPFSGEKPINSITSQTTEIDGKQRWLFSNFNPGDTDVYHFEHPDYYKEYNGEKHTAMLFRAKNLNMTGLTPVNSDWATLGPIEGWLKVKPSWQSWAASAVIGGFVNVVGFLGGAANTGRTAYASGAMTMLSVWLYQLWGGVATGEAADAYYNMQAGPMTDLGKAYSSGNLCSAELSGAIKDIGNLTSGKVGLMVGTAVPSAALDIIAIAGVATGPVGWAVTAASFALGVANWIATDQYENAKSDWLNTMKTCKETSFYIFADGVVPTQQSQKDEFSQLLDNIGSTVQGAASAISSISDQSKQAIQSITELAYSNTLNLKGTVDGKSQIRMFGDAVNYVHFDYAADVQWFLSSGGNCRFSFCENDENGGYKCISIDRYVLLGDDGKAIAAGAFVANPHWSNGEKYLGIRTSVINSVKGDGDLMEIYRDSQTLKNGCVQAEINEQTKEGIGSDGKTTSFGKFAQAMTDDAYFWFDGDTVRVNFLNEKACGGNTYRSGEIWPLDTAKSHLLLDKNGNIKVVDASGDNAMGCEFNLGENGYVLFSNGKIEAGRAAQTYTDKEGQTKSTADYTDVLHIFLFNLAEPISASEVTGAQFTGYDAENGNFSFMLDGVNQQLQDLIAKLNPSLIEGLNGEKIQFDGNGNIIIRDANGVETSYKIDKFENGIFYLTGPDGTQYQFRMGVSPDGVPEMILNGPGGETRIPIMWMPSQNGSYMYNPDSGQISIKNEFPFAINPNFGVYGAGGTSFMTATAPPWGGRTKETSTGAYNQGQQNPLAALPGVPTEYLDIVVFAAALLGGLVFIRFRYRGMKKRKDT